MTEGSTPALQASPTVTKIYGLLKERYAEPTNVQLDKTIFVSSIAALDGESCIWCQHPRIAGELLRLLSFPSNDATLWFRTRTTESLASCAACMQSYYEMRPVLSKEFGQLYEGGTLSLFWSKVDEFDAQRIGAPLGRFISGEVDHKSSPVLFALYELLLYPRHLQDPMLHEKFARVLGTLVEARKMIKVTRILPGLLTCLFDGEDEVWKWANSVLSKEDDAINRVGDFIEGSFDLVAILRKALRRGTDRQRLSLLIRWLPVKICNDYFTNHLAPALLSALDEDCSAYTSLNILLERVCPAPVVTGEFWKSFLTSVISSQPLSVLEGDYRWITAFGRWCKGANDCQSLFKGLLEVLECRSRSVSTPRERLILAIMLAALVSMDGIAPLMVMVPRMGLRMLQFLFEIVEYCTGGGLAEPIDSIPSLAKAICAIDLATLEAPPQEAKMMYVALEKMLETASFPLQNSLCEQLSCLLLERPRELWRRYGRVRPEMAKSICAHLHSIDCCASGTLDLLFALATSISWSLDARRLGEMFMSHPAKFISSYSAAIADTFATDPHQLAPLILLNREVIQRCLFTSEGTILDMFPDKLDVLQSLVNAVLLLCKTLLGGKARGGMTMAAKSTLDSLVHFIRRLLRIDASIHLNELGKEPLLWMIEELLEHYLTASKDDDLVDRITNLLELATDRRLKLTHGAQNSLGALFISLRGISCHARDRLDRSIKKYEEQVSNALPRPPLLAKKNPPTAVASPRAPPTTAVRRPAVIEIDDAFEERLLVSMQEASERRKERSLPISLRSNLISLALPGRTSSKLEQLKAEVVRDAIPVIGPTARKRPSAHVSLGGAVKLERLDDQASSASESESKEDDFMALRGKFGHASVSNSAGSGGGNVFPAMVAHSTEPFVSSARSVKLIDVTDAASGVPSRSNLRGARDEDRNVSSGAPPDEATLIRRFHQRILNFNLCQDAEEALTTEETLLTVPSRFSAPSEYISIFEPLLFTECRAQLLASAEEAATEEVRSVRIVAVTKVDKCHEVQVQGEPGAEAEGTSSSGEYRPSFRLGDQDYLLVQFDDILGAEDTTAAPDRASLAVRLPAVVVQVTFRGGASESTLRLIIPPDRPALQLKLREGSHLDFVRIGNVITNFREYMALHSIRTIALAPLILNPNLPAPMDADTTSDLNDLMANLHLNRSQARAIQAVLSHRSPITLIQGPPGTGKTRTIEGLLGTLVGRRLSRERKKILICAPSNAAIDEIVRRIRHGLCDAQGHGFSVQIIRVGAIDMISEDIRELTIENQVDRRVQHSMEASAELLGEQRRRCDELRRSLDSVERTGQGEGKVRALKTALWEAKEALRKNTKFIEDTRATVRQKILGEAQIICCTLSSSGHDMLARLDFDTVILDEACQAVELSCLIPLQRNIHRCVLVGGRDFV